MNADDLDIAFLAWSMHRNLDSARMPPGRTVVEFQFRNAPPDAAGRVQVLGPPALRKQFPSWLLLSGLAPHPRLRAGREQRLGAVCNNV